MKIVFSFLFLLVSHFAFGQRVFYPAKNNKEDFTLTINGQNYKTFVKSYINQLAYKKQWFTLISKLQADKKKELKGTTLTAVIMLLVDVDETGKTTVSDYGSISSDETIVSKESLKIIIDAMCKNLTDEIRKKGVVTPSYNKILRSYVGNTDNIEQKWSLVL